MKRRHNEQRDEDGKKGLIEAKIPVVLYKSFKKWECNFDRELKMFTWLDCEMILGGKKLVTMLKCIICCKYAKLLIQVKFTL